MHLWKGDKKNWAGPGPPPPLIWTKSKRQATFFVKPSLSEKDNLLKTTVSGTKLWFRIRWRALRFSDEEIAWPDHNERKHRADLWRFCQLLFFTAQERHECLNLCFHTQRLSAMWSELLLPVLWALWGNYNDLGGTKSVVLKPGISSLVSAG